jgi:hypothetical protein
VKATAKFLVDTDWNHKKATLYFEIKNIKGEEIIKHKINLSYTDNHEINLFKGIAILLDEALKLKINELIIEETDNYIVYLFSGTHSSIKKMPLKQKYEELEKLKKQFDQCEIKLMGNSYRFIDESLKLKTKRLKQYKPEDYTYLAWCDASSKSSRQKTMISWLIKDHNKKIMMKHSSEIPYSLDTHLNEQHSLLSLLTYLHENGYQDVLIHTDDLNLFNEIQNKYVRKMKYKEYLNETLGYLETLQNVDVKWVKRNYNQEADKLCKLAYK